MFVVEQFTCFKEQTKRLALSERRRGRALSGLPPRGVQTPNRTLATERQRRPKPSVEASRLFFEEFSACEEDLSSCDSAEDLKTHESDSRLPSECSENCAFASRDEVQTPPVHRQSIRLLFRRGPVVEIHEPPPFLRTKDGRGGRRVRNTTARRVSEAKASGGGVDVTRRYSLRAAASIVASCTPRTQRRFRRLAPFYGRNLEQGPLPVCRGS